MTRGGGSAYKAQWYAPHQTPIPKCNANIGKAPVFNPLNPNAVIPTATSGIIPTGIALAGIKTLPQKGGRILNPVSGRWVSKGGSIGKKLLALIGINNGDEVDFEYDEYVGSGGTRGRRRARRKPSKKTTRTRRTVTRRRVSRKPRRIKKRTYKRKSPVRRRRVVKRRPKRVVRRKTTVRRRR